MRPLFKAVLCSFAIFICASTASGSNSDLIMQADSAYAADDFAMAVASYEAAAQEYGTSPELYYNLGNSYYRSGYPGKAIVAYERAIKLDPTHSDARFNLEFVRTQLVDRQRSQYSVIDSFTDAVLNAASSDTWAWAGAALFLLSIGLVAIYMYTSAITLRKIGFFGVIISLPLAVLCLVAAYAGASRSTSHNRAVVTTPSVILSTAPRAPRDRNEEVALIHEGSELLVTDSVTARADSVNTVKWYKLQLDADHKGWAPASSLEII